jgi:hypothetical protein
MNFTITFHLPGADLRTSCTFSSILAEYDHRRSINSHFRFRRVPISTSPTDADTPPTRDYSIFTATFIEAHTGATLMLESSAYSPGAPASISPSSATPTQHYYIARLDIMLHDFIATPGAL